MTLLSHNLPLSLLVVTCHSPKGGNDKDDNFLGG